MDTLEQFDFDCPRCGTSTTSTLYGPCGECVGRLRSQVAAAARDLDAPAYQPKVNVTPNAVALKE